MSFILEVKKKCKDIIVFNNNKYRESYSVKNGDIVWRCLGKSCKAYVRTNPEKNAIYSSNETHNGQHPITMRALTPTPPQPRRRLSPRTPTGLANTPVLSTVSKSTTAHPQPQTDSTPSYTVLTQEAPIAIPLTTTVLSPSSKNLQKENFALQEELARLRVERQAVLDHSIESDQRLLLYTDTVFLPPPCLSVTTSEEPKTNQDGERNKLPCSPAVRGCSEDLRRALKRIQELEQEIIKLSQPCNICAILKEQTTNMIASLRCLEEENKQLKNDVIPRHPHTILDTAHQTVPILKLHNRYEALQKEGMMETEEDSGYVKVYRNNSKNKKKDHNKTFNRHPKNKTIEKENVKQKFLKAACVPIPFKSVSVIGDSHTRDLASMMRRHVDVGSSISGMCKPGARLLDVKPTSSPPKDHCYVLMAGTNDVGVGSKNTIFNHMEDVLLTCKRNSSRVIVVSLPTRYDIAPNSSIHQKVRLMNNYLAELCHRCDGVQFLDISGFPRHHYTAHGLHLRARGKLLLAHLVVERLALMSPLSDCTQPGSEPITSRTESLTSSSPPQQYDTYADVVSKTNRCNGDAFSTSNRVFLENVTQKGKPH